MNREKAWDIITLLCFIDLLLLVLKVFSASPIKEPEFINSYCIMTSDDSFELLQSIVIRTTHQSCLA